nr:PREDICTED: agglutinin-1-like isoform X2 [Daucus carota subsp. sativus]
MAISIIVSRLLFSAVTAACLASSICSARDKVLLMPPEKIEEKFTFYPILPFDTAQATLKRYTRFINNVREEIVSGDTVHGIPRLYNPVKLEESDRYLQVALFNSDEQRISLAIDKSDVYIVGYRTEYEACFFSDTDGADTSSLFPGITRHQLPFKNGYSGMEEIAGSRRDISLGMSELDECIKHLHDLTDNSSLARCMLITIQMVAEAVRYRYVENLLVEHIGETNEG